MSGEAPSMPEPASTETPASAGPLVVVDAVGTVALVAMVAAAALSDAKIIQQVGLGLSAVLFLGGCLGFAIGFLRAVGRSRTEIVDLAGLFYLTESAPRAIRRAMLGLWFIQIAAAAAAIAVTEPPFAVMAPVWGIGLITWWASLHATFPPRPAPSRR